MKAEDFTKNINGELQFFRVYNSRWNDYDNNPKEEDEKFYLCEEEAYKAFENATPDVSFEPRIDKLTFVPEDEEEFEIRDIIHLCDHEILDVGPTNHGDDITDSIVIEWNYEKYVGYARNLTNIGIAGNYPFSEVTYEDDLITGNEGSTFRSNYSVLLTADEVKNSVDLRSDIEEALNAGYWKWNHFKNNPSSAFINDQIDEIVNYN